MKICLDAGHFGVYNQSPANKAYFESQAMWKLHLLQKKHLEHYGFEVIMTRQNLETDKEAYSRGTMAKGCDLFVSSHSNAVPSGVSEATDYPVVIVALNGKGNVIGEKLAACVESVMGTKQKGRIMTKEGNGGADYYGVIRGAVSVGVVPVLIEHSFHTQPAATNWLLNDSNLDRMAQAEALTIAEYFNMSTQPPKPDHYLTPIMGVSLATTDQMAAYLISKNPDAKPYAAEVAGIFLAEGLIEGVRGDIAFAQSCLETGNFTFKGSAVTLDQNNFCGMGVTSNGMRGNSFDTPQLGIRAQIHHLKAYGSKEALVNENQSPRFQYVTRGCAEFFEWLGQKENPNGKGWATGENYGAKILNIWSAILSIPKEEPKQDAPPVPHADVSEWAREAWEWGIKNSFFDGTRPKSNLTREEAITLFHRFFTMFEA